MSSFSPSKESMTKLESAARILREAILEGDLVPGQRLRQQELAERLGMSSTPIREVLRILEAEGLLVRAPYKGVYVAEISPDESEEIATIRSVLEGLAVKMGTPRLTPQDIAQLESLHQRMEEARRATNIAQMRRLNYRFHALLYKASGSRRLWETIERLWPWFATDILWMIPGRAERSIQQHQAILDAVKAGDAELAGKHMSDHILTAGRTIASFVRQRSEHRSPELSDLKP